jgi:hypothetical protein
MGGIADKRRGVTAAEVLALIASDGVQLTATAPASLGTSNAVGSGTEAARDDHVHAHGVFASGDLHTEYQREAEKGAANGYAGLDGSSQVPAGNAPAKSVYASGGAQALIPSDIGASERHSTEITAQQTTPDAVPVTCGSYPIPDNMASQVRVQVVARRDTGAEAAAYEYLAAFRRSGGTVTQIGGTIPIMVREDVPSWSVAILIAGTNINVDVTGALGSTINWYTRIEAHTVG